MPTRITYPGVDIEQSPSGVHTITGVKTSVAAFIDIFKQGPMNKAVKILNIQDFEHEFGGLDSKSEASYAIEQFFLNGGSEAWVVRIGDIGSPPKSSAIIGSLKDKSGIYALEDVDFNILSIPLTATITKTNIKEGLTPKNASAVIAAAINYCEKRHAFYIIDTPNNISDVEAIKQWLANNASLPKKNASLYFPHVKVADPTNNYTLKSHGASGTIAGLYARTDATRGVWKSPAGIDATLVNVQALDYKITNHQNDDLNTLGINCLRSFPLSGNVCWGARTLDGADINSEWKYIPVRRLALYIEESLYQGTKWVVFEPNDEPLWTQIRQSVEAFMQNLFRNGAFQGTTPSDAYFVKCDKETTTKNEITLGIVNIVVGFAPNKPAEFVFIKIQQMAGQKITEF
ncbi:MAG TPA: phage tail sheath C-terminal domain-containing protein [Nitrososphaerales archaeon]